jgi:hypothetical protein
MLKDILAWFHEQDKDWRTWLGHAGVMLFALVAVAFFRETVAGALVLVYYGARELRQYKDNPLDSLMDFVAPLTVYLLWVLLFR